MPSSHRSTAALHALLHEKLDALLAESDHVIDTAQHGRTLHDLDDFFCTKGQEFPKKSSKNNSKNASPKPKPLPNPNSVPTVKKTQYQNTKAKTATVVHGHLALHYRYRYCRHCDFYSFSDDVTLILETSYTERLQRIVALFISLSVQERAVVIAEEAHG